MADDRNESMNKRLRLVRVPPVKLRADGRIVAFDDAPEQQEPAPEQEAPPTRPTGDADQGVRGTNPPAEPGMSARIRAVLRHHRNPTVYPDDDPRFYR